MNTQSHYIDFDEYKLNKWFKMFVLHIVRAHNILVIIGTWESVVTTQLAMKHTVIGSNLASLPPSNRLLYPARLDLLLWK